MNIQSGITLSDLVGIVGVVLVVGGLFAPLISINTPDIARTQLELDSYTLWELSEAATALLLALVGVALFALGRGWRGGVLTSAFGTGGLGLYSWYAARNALLEGQDYPLFANPLGRLFHSIIIDSVQMEAPWLLIFGGAITLALAAWQMRFRQSN